MRMGEICMVLVLGLSGACAAPAVQTRESSPSSVGIPKVGWGPSGRPEGPHLLVSDQATQTVTLIDLGGRVVQRYEVAQGQPGGVTHAREDGMGFWVCVTTPSSEDPLFVKMSWEGEVVTSFSVAQSYRGCRGLDMHLDPEHGAILSLVTRNTNDIDVVGGVEISSKQRIYEAGFHDGSFLSGYWGQHTYSGSYEKADRLNTHTEGRFERWQMSDFKNIKQSIPAGAPRGITRTPSGELFVVDSETHSVLVFMGENGVLERSFTTPDNTPAGISYGE